MHDLTLAQVRTLDRGRLLDEFPRAEVVNGVSYAARSHFGYYTSTTRKLFMRLAVDPVTHEPDGEPEFVAGGTIADDFCIDEDAGVAYVTTHRKNTIDAVGAQGRAHAAGQELRAAVCSGVLN